LTQSRADSNPAPSIAPMSNPLKTFFKSSNEKVEDEIFNYVI